MVDLAALDAQMNEDVAALMVTNPEHARRLRAGHPQDRRDPARQGRPALHGRRQHERAGRHVASRRFRRRRDAPQPAQDLLDAARRRRSRLRSGGGEEDARAVPAHAGADHEARWHAGLRLQPPAVHRPRARVLRQLRHARPRAGLHPGARPRRPAPDHRRRRAQRQLHPQGARSRITICRTPRPSMHEVVFSDKRQAKNGVRPATSPSA